MKLYRSILPGLALAAAFILPATAFAQGSGAGGEAFSTCVSKASNSDTWSVTYAATAFDVQTVGFETTADFIQYSVLLTDVKRKGADTPFLPAVFVDTLVGFCEEPGVVDLDPPLCKDDGDCAAPAVCVDQPIPLPGNATYVQSALTKIEDDLGVAVCGGACRAGETLCVESIADGATDSSAIPGDPATQTITEMSRIQGLIITSP